VVNLRRIGDVIVLANPCLSCRYSKETSEANPLDWYCALFNKCLNGTLDDPYRLEECSDPRKKADAFKRRELDILEELSEITMKLAALEKQGIVARRP
jgi:hypothetical protein